MCSICLYGVHHISAGPTGQPSLKAAPAVCCLLLRHDLELKSQGCVGQSPFYNMKNTT